MDAGEHNRIVAVMAEDARTAFLRGVHKGYIYGMKNAKLTFIQNVNLGFNSQGFIAEIEKQIEQERAANIPKDIALPVLLEDLTNWITYNHRHPARLLMEQNIELIKNELKL